MNLAQIDFAAASRSKCASVMPGTRITVPAWTLAPLQRTRPVVAAVTTASEVTRSGVRFS